ncbi:MAG: hypothetical protein JKY28_05130 [Sulfurimonas sp.]|nr:hypothetical protein [Sulfurimonas sp.]PHQ89686.1 MAG: hypothetical protein COB42_06445 [Sulfurimonas sp.]
MLNLNELESRWLRYKIKSYIPHFSILMSLLILGILFISIDFSSSTTPSFEKKQILALKKEVFPKKDVVVEAKPVVAEKETTPKEAVKKAISSPRDTELLKTQNQKILIKPSLNFMNNIKQSSPQYYRERALIPPQKKTIENEGFVEEVPEESQDILVDAPEVEIVTNPTISIQRQNTYEDIEHVVKRFKKSNNPALSLFVAKKYYELENYNQAYNYALITNELNNDIEESWIIFIKSLVKLDKKDKAREVLKKYISNTHSQRAKILLDNINSGKL